MTMEWTEAQDLELGGLYAGINGPSYQQVVAESEPATGAAHARAWWEVIKPIICNQYAEQPEVREKLLRDGEEVNARR